MNKRNIIPLVLSTILIGLIFIFSILRLNYLSIWYGKTINFDIVISGIYIVWMIFELKISKKELSKGNKTSDFGTCELYAIGQAGVLLSALWFHSFWTVPNIFHIFGFILFISGIIFRIWAIITLGRYYSHIVREVEEHKIIDSGPYHHIRHPAYAGMILANTGITIFFFNTVTVLFFFLVLLPAIIARILIEEKTLFKIEGYSKFAKSKKRLVPVIW